MMIKIDGMDWKVGEFKLDDVNFEDWVGFADRGAGGLYAADQDQLRVWRIPAEVPTAWEIAAG